MQSKHLTAGYSVKGFIHRVIVRRCRLATGINGQGTGQTDVVHCLYGLSLDFAGRICAARKAVSVSRTQRAVYIQTVVQ